MNAEEKIRFERMEENIKSIQKDVSNILNALIGNNINGNKGLIHKVEILEKEQITLKGEISDLKEENIKNESLIHILKWVSGSIVGSILAYVVIQIITK